MTERFTARVAIYVFLEQEGKILLTHRYNTKYMNNRYAVPGGHLEEGESLQAGAVREAREEAGIEIAQEDLRFVHLSYRPAENLKDEYVDIYFAASTWSGTIHNPEPERHDEVAWYPLDDLPEHIIPYEKAALDFYKQGIAFNEPQR